MAIQPNNCMTSHTKKGFSLAQFKEGKIALLYLVSFCIIYFLLYNYGWINVLPSEDGVVSWDAHFYKSIKNSGYEFRRGGAANSGFFPLFAYWWQLLGLSGAGMGILNGIIYLGSTIFLVRELKIDNKVLAVFLCSPVMYCFFVPLSEALFFLFSVVIIIAMSKQNFKLLFAGILLASVTRASFFFFIPAFVGIAWMTKDRFTFWKTVNYKRLLIHCILPSLLGLATVMLIQYIQTGEYLAYFKTQTTTWSRVFSLPRFPLIYSKNIHVNALSTSSLWTGLLAAFISFWLLIKWLFKNEKFTGKEIHLFALIFLSMALVSIVFFNPKWAWYNPGEGAVAHVSTYINGINRYIFCNAFFLLFLSYLYQHLTPSKEMVGGFFILTLFMLYINDPSISNYAKNNNYITVVKLLWPITFTLFYSIRKAWATVPICIVGITMQCFYLSYFMTSIQVD